MHRQRPDCDLCMMYTVASTERLTAATQRLQGLVASACTLARHGAPSFACDRHRNKAAPAQKLQRCRTFKERCEIREVARSFLRRARVRMPMPCRWRLSTGSDPKIRSALHSQKRYRMFPTLFHGESRGQPLKRRVDAAYLQPCGFRFQLSRFLPAEHQRLLRRLVTWQLL